MKNRERIWRYMEDVNQYRMFDLINQPPGFDVLDLFRTGKRLGEKWKPIKIGLWEDPENKKEKDKPIADFASAGTAPAINEKAKSIVSPLISRTVELLPLLSNKDSYYAMNVELVDCLDVGNSIVERFKSSNRIMSVEIYAFNWDRLEGINMFRIPELGLGRLFVTDTFKQKVEDAKLLGLLFSPIPLVEE